MIYFIALNHTRTDANFQVYVLRYLFGSGEILPMTFNFGEIDTDGNLSAQRYIEFISLGVPARIPAPIEHA